MRIQPILYLEHLTDEETQQYECSDKFWLPRRLFETLVGDAPSGVTVIVKLINVIEQYIVGTPHSVHHNLDADEVIYVPSWMYDTMIVDEDIRVETINPGLCTRLMISPHTSDHIHAEDPQELLRTAFENYTCLQVDQEIPLWIGTKQLKVTIQGLQPDTLDPLCIRDVEIELELLPPLDMPWPPPPREPTPPPTPPSSQAEPIVGEPGIPVGGTAPQPGLTPAQLAGAAARARIQRMKDSASTP